MRKRQSRGANHLDIKGKSSHEVDHLISQVRKIGISSQASHLNEYIVAVEV